MGEVTIDQSPCANELISLAAPGWRKLNIARKRPTKQRVKANKARGLKKPDSEEEFFCMGGIVSLVVMSYVMN